MSDFVFSKRFLPLFITQFFGAFNDNFLKNAIVILVAYRMGRTESEIGFLSNLAAGLFILPYFLFSAVAGELADKYGRAACCRAVKLAEIVLMAGAAAAFGILSLPALLVLLFLMGAQSTFFSPVKYSLLPVLLREEELLRGNAWIEGGSYLAILTGTITGSLVIGLPGGEFWSGGILVFLALAGYLASRQVPPVKATAPELKPEWNPLRGSLRIIRECVWRNRSVRACVLSSSVFWLAGSLLIAQTPFLVKIRLGGDEKICTLFFVLFSVGIGIGSALAGRLFRKCRTGFDLRIVFAIALMGLLVWDLAWIACGPASPPAAAADLFRRGHFLHAAFVYLLIAVCGGVWAVPVKTRMQISSPDKQLARVIAGENILNSFAMAFGAFAAAFLSGRGAGPEIIFLLLGAGILLTSVLMIPQARMKKVS